NGYLPVEGPERTKKIRQLENKIYNEDQTQIFIETPYRNAKLIESIISTCRPQTKFCIACDITGANEYIKTKTCEEWKKKGVPDLGKTPAIFLIYK
ncbi:MAG: SAM-dependent methyltransferase, partial [Treponema sp.]|nr:SAM-dependent methyltransferase [Treponema sp.]